LLRAESARSRSIWQPDKGIKESPENLGEYLAGDKIENSGYEVRVLHAFDLKLTLSALDFDA
jgi:hypothetical protein